MQRLSRYLRTVVEHPLFSVALTALVVWLLIQAG